MNGCQKANNRRLKVFDTHVVEKFMITPLTGTGIHQLSTIFVPNTLRQLETV